MPTHPFTTSGGNGRDAEVRQARAEETLHWGLLGESFPSLKNAYSTKFYRRCERILVQEYFPELAGRKILKTDLWNEARSSELLFWLSEQGARGVGVDLALSTTRLAKANCNGHNVKMLVGDVRELPFRDGVFDYIYSMGTIEHFPDYRKAAAELYRVLAPGGRAIIGVPNLFDPFLRPLLVSVLSWLGKYPYSPEKAFSAAQLRKLLAGAGFEVHDITGALFMPGWLRLLDLWLTARRARLAKLTAWATKPFVKLYLTCPRLRRHSYLVAAVVHKPQARHDASPTGVSDAMPR